MVPSVSRILCGPGTKQLDLLLFKAFPFSADGARRVVLPIVLITRGVLPQEP
jgi:hypothetical protein